MLWKITNPGVWYCIHQQWTLILDDISIFFLLYQSLFLEPYNLTFEYLPFLIIFISVYVFPLFSYYIVLFQVANVYVSDVYKALVAKNNLWQHYIVLMLPYHISETKLSDQSYSTGCSIGCSFIRQRLVLVKNQLSWSENFFVQNWRQSNC